MVYSNTLLSMISAKMSLPTSKNANDDILKLEQPMIIDRFTKKDTLEILSSSSLTQDTTFTILQPKPISKLDKRIKKIDKDENSESEINRLKLKKKIRTKISFEEDLESVADLYKNLDPINDTISTTLARPIKPDSHKITSHPRIKSSETPKHEKKAKSTNKKIPETTQINITKEIILTNPITVEELSKLSSIPKSAMIKSLFLRGITITANQLIDPNIAQKLGEEFGISISLELQDNGILKNIELTNNSLSSPRPPIVTVMGHVDHGKTTLLDKIRKTQYAQREIGGITQKIGAHEVILTYNNKERKIVFLDTPGHEAFSKMRLRGISISDIAILVVAADDGVRPQTIEAIEQIQSTKIPLIIAINKIDKDNANIETIKKELTNYNIISEEWGGDTLMVPISALQGTNMDKLLETVLLLTDLLDLRANPNAPAKGMILESNLDKTRGAVASLIIKEGTLHVGDTITIDDTIARIRGMINPAGEPIRSADPSSAAIVWGLSKIPVIGTQFFSFKDEKEAKLFIDSSAKKSRSSINSQVILSTLDDRLHNKKQINLIIKADSQGSLEAISSNILTQYNSKIQVRILQSSVGEITGTDLEFASASKSDILAFNTTYATGVKKSAKNTNITIKEFNIIYDLFDYIQVLIDEKIGPQYEERLTGTCIVKTVFPLAKSFVAGTSVREGRISKTSFIHVIRDSNIIYKGYINSLKRVKEDILEVSEGSECGIFITEFGSWKPGDTIQAFDLIEKKLEHSKSF